MDFSIKFDILSQNGPLNIYGGVTDYVFSKKYYTVKTVLSGHSKLTPKIDFQD